LDHKIELTERILGKRSSTIDVPEAEVDLIPQHAIISKEPAPPAKFEMEEPSSIVEPGKEEENKKAWKKYRGAKERWEAAHADDKPMIRVNLWLPVKMVEKATMDGYEVRLFHTMRGPIMGMVTSEDSTRAWLLSPCFIDPNIEPGRLHYLPIAFAGYKFMVYKRGMGESIPQEAEVEGYPYFVKRNKEGDYAFRLKAAYHHIEADLPPDSQLVSTELGPRDALLGLVATSDSREGKFIEKGRRLQKMVEVPQPKESS
jgi:hypothetical protein